MKNYLLYTNFWFRNFTIFTVYLIFTLLEYLSDDYFDFYNISIAEYLIYMIINFFFIMTFNMLFVKKLFIEKKYSMFILAFCLCTLFASIFQNRIIVSFTTLSTNYIIDFISLTVLFLTGTAIYFLHIWVLENIINTKKKLLATAQELNFLKEQLSPHFLFNALNNLYGFALAEPERIDKKILELADLLRYQVEAISKEAVSVNEEMKFIQNYLDYALSRNNNLVVQNQIFGEIKKSQIPPLLFLPFAENAVKYSSELDFPSINLEWEFLEDCLVFRIKNNFRKENSKIFGTKTGLKNVQRRLELLIPKHEITIDQDLNNEFTIELKLWNLPIKY